LLLKLTKGEMKLSAIVFTNGMGNPAIGIIINRRELITIAIFHCQVKIIGRTSGRSCVGAAAYRAGERLKNERDGITHDFTNKRGIVYTEIMLPDYAPIEYRNRETLWNAVEKSEKAKNAQTAREIEIGLPIELDEEDQVNLVWRYAKKNFVDRGMCADIAIHDKGDGNPHAHIMLTMRSIGKDGKWLAKSKKIYDLDENGNRQYDPMKRQYKSHKETINGWDKKENVEHWRAQWAAECNKEFELLEMDERIDHRSYERQGIEQIPTMHLGPIEHHLQERGIKGERAKYNDEVRQINREYAAAKEQIANELEEIKLEIAEQAMREQLAREQKAKEQHEREYQAREQQIREQQVKEQQASTPTAEQIVERLSALKIQYIKLEYQKIVIQAANQEIQDKIHNINANTAYLMNIKSQIAEYTEDIERLEDERAHLGFFSGKAKKRLSHDIDRLQESRQTAIDKLYSKYKFMPEGIDSYIQVLNARLSKLSPVPLEDDEKHQPIDRQQKDIENQYAKILKSVEQHPEKENIESMLDELSFKGKNDNMQMAIKRTQDLLKNRSNTYTPQQQTNISQRQIRSRSRSLSMER